MTGLFVLAEDATPSLATQLEPITNAILEHFTVANMVAYLGIGIGAAAGIVLAKWGIRKVISMVTGAFKRGTLRA